MKKLFRRRRVSKNAASPFSVNENEPINDNLYLAAASQAAVADKASGAYDEFLFNDDSLRTMPFETAVDSHSKLLAARLVESKRVEIVRLQQRTGRANSTLHDSSSRVASLQALEVETLSEIADQESILQGEKVGRHEVFWPGSKPIHLNQFSTLVRLSLPVIIFLLVGAADFKILRMSLGSIFTSGNEVTYFAIPAIGIQVAFPHMIGERLAWLRRGSPRKKFDFFSLIGLTFAWLLFCEALTQIRMIYAMDNVSFSTKFEPWISPSIAIEVLTLLMIVGLGVILIFTSSTLNPHEYVYAQLRWKLSRTQKKLEEARNAHHLAEIELQILELELENSRNEFSAVLAENFELLAEAAKRVYRRALVNQFGKTDFTSAYLSSEFVQR